MDSKLRRELDAIHKDRLSGAAELTLRSAWAIEKWLGRHPAPSPAELKWISWCLVIVIGRFAPLWRLANELLLAIDSPDPGRHALSTCRQMRATIRRASRRIAREFVRALPPSKNAYVITHSYSSTVLQALRKARNRIYTVVCSESRPDCEGRVMAARLARAGLRVCFTSDAVLPSFILDPDCRAIVVTGADLVEEERFLNKAGTQVLADAAAKARRPFWILADTTKLVPQRAPEGPGWSDAPKEALWKAAPSGVLVFNSIFGVTQLHPRMRFLTERGWMTPARVRRELKKIRISPRLKSLVD